MASLRKKVEKRAGFFAFSKLSRAFLKKDPLEAEKAGAKLGLLVYRLSAKHRNVALSNLKLAFPEMSEAERIELAQRCFQHFGRIFADFLRSSARTNEDVIRDCELLGTDHIDRALDGGHGILLVTGHFGNWEIAAHRYVAAGYKLSVVSRDANDGDLNQSVMRIREKHGIQVLSRGQAARGMLGRLKQNESIAVLTDQNSGDLFVPFFGKPCGTVTGPISIHLKTGAPMIPLYSARVGPGKYELRNHAPLQPVEGYEPIEGMARAMNNALEARIRQDPEQWLWFHDRWKSARRAGLV